MLNAFRIHIASHRIAWMILRTHAVCVCVCASLYHIHSIYYTTDIGLIFSGFLLLLVHNIKERAYGINNQVDKSGSEK